MIKTCLKCKREVDILRESHRIFYEEPESRILCDDCDITLTKNKKGD